MRSDLGVVAAIAAVAVVVVAQWSLCYRPHCWIGTRGTGRRSFGCKRSECRVLPYLTEEAKRNKEVGGHSGRRNDPEKRMAGTAKIKP